jgi:hypothetical protein
VALTAVLSSGYRRHDGLDSPLPQDEVEIRSEESAVAVLLNDVFAWLRCQVTKDINALRSIDQARPIRDRLIQVVIHSHIASVTPMNVCGVNDANSLFTAKLQRRRKLAHRFSETIDGSVLNA